MTPQQILNDSRARLVFPLDVPTIEEARTWAHRLRDHVGGFKIGMELFYAHGPDIVQEIRGIPGRVIVLDLKLHDIPETVRRAVASLGDLNVDYLTIHAAGGEEMLRAAQGALDNFL